MKKCYRKVVLVLGTVLMCSMLAGCGCGKKKDKDEASQKVMEITITPEATPTPAPNEIDPDAVVEKNGITMVNEYLAGQGGGQTSDTPDSEDDAGAMDDADENTDGENDAAGE